MRTFAALLLASALAAVLLPLSAGAWAYGPTGYEMSGYQAQAYLNSLNSSSLYTVPHPYYTSAGAQYAGYGYGMNSYGYNNYGGYGNGYGMMPYQYVARPSYSYPSSYNYNAYSYPTYSNYPSYMYGNYGYASAYMPMYYFNNY